jgi:hypothetical protein
MAMIYRKVDFTIKFGGFEWYYHKFSDKPRLVCGSLVKDILEIVPMVENNRYL